MSLCTKMGNPPNAPDPQSTKGSGPTSSAKGPAPAPSSKGKGKTGKAKAAVGRKINSLIRQKIEGTTQETKGDVLPDQPPTGGAGAAAAHQDDTLFAVAHQSDQASALPASNHNLTTEESAATSSTGKKGKPFQETGEAVLPNRLFFEETKMAAPYQDNKLLTTRLPEVRQGFFVTTETLSSSSQNFTADQERGTGNNSLPLRPTAGNPNPEVFSISSGDEGQNSDRMSAHSSWGPKLKRNKNSSSVSTTKRDVFAHEENDKGSDLAVLNLRPPPHRANFSLAAADSVVISPVNRHPYGQESSKLSELAKTQENSLVAESGADRYTKVFKRLQKEAKKGTNDREALQEQVDSTVLQIEKLKSSLEKYIQEREKLESKISRKTENLQNLKEARDELCKEKSELTKRLEKKQGELHEAYDMVASYKNAYAELQERCGEIESELLEEVSAGRN